MQLANSIAHTVNDLKPYALKLTHDHEEANDLIQETVLKALRYQKKFQEGTNLKGWLYTIMRNTFINQYRSKVRHNTWSEPTENLAKININKTQENEADVNLRMEELLEELEKLSPELKTPILMLYKGYKYEEIAEMLKVPVGTVKSRVFIVRRMMRERLKEHRALD